MVNLLSRNLIIFPASPANCMKNTIYFPGLSGIRAIAALIVMVFHTDQWSRYFGLEPYGFWDTRMQSYAVVLFFVLSGFLITYLLLKEKEVSGTVNLPKFYGRRILRIWPVYYTVLIVGLILLSTFPAMIDQGPKDNLTRSALAYTFFLPNIAFFFGYSPDLIGILWSVGVEEQFYAFWPVLVKKAKKLAPVLIAFLLGYLVFKYMAYTGRFSFAPIDLATLTYFLPFDLMAIGAVAAYLFYKKSPVLKVIYHPVCQIIGWGWLLVSIFYQPVQLPFFPMFDKEYHAIVYATIILNVSTNPKTIVSLENKVFDFLGRISYGIYAYHFIVLFLLSLGLRHVLPLMSSLPAHLLMFTAEAITSILVAYLSYEYFEKRFLKRKKKMMVVQSTPTRGSVRVHRKQEELV